MIKRLMLILAFAFVVGIAFTAYAEVQNVKVSGDLTVYGILRDLTLGTVDRSLKDQSLASIARLRVDADLTDNVIATVRLLNERYWGEEEFDGAAGQDGNSDISLDLAYATLKEFLYSPATLMVGRQELRYGNAMIIGDVDTNNNVTTASAFSSTIAGVSDDADLSARKAFDAIRLVLNYDPLIIDIIGAKINESVPAAATGKRNQDDQDLYGINANYALSKTTTVEGYWFEKHDGNEIGTLPNKTDRVDVLGARIVTQPIEHLTFQLEGAYQLGKDRVAAANRSPDRRAWAVETALTCDKPNMKYSPSVTALYAYFTGRKGNENRNSAWDPMFEDQKFGDIANAQFNQSNAHIAGAIGSMKPFEDVTLIGEYYAFWWDKKFGDQTTTTSRRGNVVLMEHNKFAGQEIDLKAIYNYTEDVQFGLLTGVFLPGSSFADANDRMASEVIGSMKVTF